MDSQIKIAPCGLVCSRCDAYRATQLNDQEKLELVAAKWRELNHCDDIKAEYLPCDGCMSECGRKSFFCTNLCGIRKCIIRRGFQVCSDCPDYQTCKILESFISHAPEGQAKAMKKLLDGIADVKKNMTSAFE